MRTIRHTGFGLLGIALASMVVVAACRGPRPPGKAATRSPEVPAVPVRLADVTSGPVSRPIRGTGLLRLKREMDLSFKVGGVVAAVLVEEGARVKKGQVLARLDPTEVDAALRQAKEGTAKAERDLDRVKRLHASGALAISELQNAQTGFELARAGNDAAAFNAQRATILAPDDGRIDRRLIETGEVVTPARPVFHMSGQSKGAVVRIGVSDRDVLRIHEGDAARILIDAQPDVPVPATVTQVATVASPGSGTFEVEVKLAETSLVLLSGLTAKVEIAHVENVPAVVPVGAVSWSSGGEDASVFVVTGDRAQRVKVKLAFLDGAHAALSTSILEAHPRVIDTGAALIEDGTRVKVVP